MKLNPINALIDRMRVQLRQHAPPRVTVIINTYNRARSLKRTLKTLRKQTYPNFEVVVVNGPSTDTTEALLKRNALDIKIAVCQEAHLGRSRNIGIDNAAGEIVAFIDDDALPSDDWLENLVGAYRDSLVMAAGGYVLHQNGLIWGLTTCSRSGDVVHSAEPPASRYLEKGADPFLYLSGCNMSFRRTALISVGGFNEDLSYGYDDVEICRRIVDAGHRIAFLEDAVVYHYPEANAVRDINGLTTDPYAPMRARAVFALQDESNKTRLDEVITRLRHASDFRNYAEDCFRLNFLSAEQRDAFLRQLEQGVIDGLAIGLQQRPVRRFTARPKNPFRRFRAAPKRTATK